MGYSHYWELKDGHKLNNDKLKNAVKHIGNFVKLHSNDLANRSGEFESNPEVTNKSVMFNGILDESHETFSIKANWNGAFDFCKTNEKAYDKYVVGALCILKHFVNPDVLVTSDGTFEDHAEGYGLYLDYILNQTEEQNYGIYTANDDMYMAEIRYLTEYKKTLKAK